MSPVMVIRIGYISVENLGLFRNKHQLNLGETEEASTDVIIGPNGSGKTTLIESIRLCLAGEFEGERPLVSFELVDQLSPGEEASGSISTVISDSELSRTFRFSRAFQTTETSSGPVNSVAPLQAEEEIGSEWVSINSSKALNTVFPLPAFTFCDLDSESYLGFAHPTNSLSWDELVKDVREAAAQQSAAREIDLPEICSNTDDLSDEMLRRINRLLAAIDFRYRVEERENGLIGRPAGAEPGGKAHGLPAGERTIISQITALVAAISLPATPPLLADSLFSRIDSPNRENLFGIIQSGDQQVLLVASELELEGLDITPLFRLERNDDDMSSEILDAD